jgi:imidazolonepropionase-like amidohydrolase
VAVHNARLITMNGPVIENGTLVVKGEKIVAVEAGAKVPLLAKRIDAKGGTVTPGLIDPFSVLGRTGSSTGSANPMRRAEDAFDRYDTANLLEALRHGVTAVYVSPRGPSGVVGTGAVVRLAAGSSPQSLGRVLRSEAALCIDLGSQGKPLTRLKTLAAVRKQFRDAMEYRKTLEKYEEDLKEYKKKLKEYLAKKAKQKKEQPKEEKPAEEEKKEEEKEGEEEKKPVPPKPAAAGEQATDDEKKEEEKDDEKEAKPTTAEVRKEDDKPKKPQRPPRKPNLTLLLRVVDREMPVRILAHRSEDILNALELAEEFHPEVILEGAAEAHLTAKPIAEAKVPVVLGNMSRFALKRDDPFRRAVSHPGSALRTAGVRWIVGSGAEQGATARFVAMNAQLAADDGQTNPLELVTAEAAELLGVDGQIGRLAPGRMADFVVWSSDPLDPASKVTRVYVGGALVYEGTDGTEKGDSK